MVDLKLRGNILITGTLMRGGGNIEVGYIILHIFLCSFIRITIKIVNNHKLKNFF